MGGDAMYVGGYFHSGGCFRTGMSRGRTWRRPSIFISVSNIPLPLSSGTETVQIRTGPSSFEQSRIGVWNVDLGC